MKTYEITIERIAYRTLLIVADDEEQAEELAWKLYDGDADDCTGNTIFNIEEVNHGLG